MQTIKHYETSLQYLLQRFLPHENECVFNWAISSHIELKTNLFTFITINSLHAEHIPLAKLQKKTTQIMEALQKNGYKEQINYELDTQPNKHLKKIKQENLTANLLPTLVKSQANDSLTNDEQILTAIYCLDNSSIITPKLPDIIQKNKTIFNSIYGKRLPEVLLSAVRWQYSKNEEDPDKYNAPHDTLQKIAEIVPTKTLNESITATGYDKNDISFLSDILSAVEDPQIKENIVMGTKIDNSIKTLTHLFTALYEYPEDDRIIPVIEKTCNIIQNKIDTLPEKTAHKFILTTYRDMKWDLDDQILNLVHSHLPVLITPPNTEAFIAKFEDEFIDAEATELDKNLLNRLQIIFTEKKLNEQIPIKQEKTKTIKI